MGAIAPADATAIARAAMLLSQGELVVIPTETVYGLAADATDPRAIARLYAVKGRPSFNPLIAHVRGRAEAAEQALLHPRALALIEAFWPGPLTIVAPRRPGASVCELACAGLPTVALRAPAHPGAQALLAAFGGPLAAPSANRSGRLSPTHAAHAAEDLGEAAALILDAGPCALGVESSIVAVTGAGEALLLRAGAIESGRLEAVAGPLARASAGDPVRAPGMLARHYAPRARLRLDADRPEPGEAYLAFGARAGDLNLSPAGDPGEAAANLFAHLRALDASGVPAIAVAPIPEAGLGEAINDRLRRAAEGR